MLGACHLMDGGLHTTFICTKLLVRIIMDVAYELTAWPPQCLADLTYRPPVKQPYTSIVIVD